MAARTSAATGRAERVLVITRVFDAPRELVFKAWTEREHLIHWMSPRGFTIPAADGDLRPGGAWTTTMHPPQGPDLHLQGVYREIIPPERLVFTHAWLGEDGTPGHETLVTVTFAERGAKTEVTLRQAEFESVAERDGHRGGWTQCFERLAEHLTVMSRTKRDTTTFALPTDRTVVMTRVFDAPRELVFQAYTDPASIPHWWGPAKYTTTVDRMDVRPGGAWRFVSRGKDGAEHAFRGTYREILPSERLVYTFEYEGAPGVIVLDTVIFEALGGQTKVTATSSFQTAADRDGMLHAGMEQGAVETWERFARVVAARRATGG